MKMTMIRYSAYRNMILSFILLTVMIIAIVCFTLFWLFSRSSAQEIGTMSETMLGQTSYAANIVKEQAMDMGNQLLNNNTLISAMYNKKIDRIQEYHAVRTLTSIQSVYPFISFIGLYNGYTNRYINNKGIAAADEQELLDTLKTQNNEMYYHLFPRTVPIPSHNGVRHTDVITFVLSPGHSSYLPQKGAIVINIDAKYLDNLIGKLKNRSSEFMIVMDGEGTVLSHTDTGRFMSSVSAVPYAKRMLTADKKSDHFVTDVDGVRSLVTYVKSEELNWYFISVNRYDAVLANIHHLKKITLMIAFAMLLLCIALSVWLTNQIYHPLKNLMKKIKENIYNDSDLKRVNEFVVLGETFSDITAKVSSMEPALSVAQKSSLLRYIKGSQVDLSNRYEAPLIGPYFGVIMLRIDGLQRFIQHNSPKMQDLIRFAICNIAQEFTEKYGKMETFVINDDEIGLLGQLQNSAYSPHLKDALATVQENVSKLFGLSLTIGIGPVVQSAEHIRDSYYGARRNTENRFFKGRGLIFDRTGATYESDTEIPYPARQETKIIEAIQQNHRESLTIEIAQFMEAMNGVAYHRALFFLNQLLVALYKQFEVSSPIAREEAKLFMELAFNLTQRETLAEVSEQMAQICFSLCDEMEARTKHKNHEVIDNIRTYISHHYARSDLSLELLADQVQWTPGYLGKMFKAHCGMPFNDYLKHVRLEKAKEMLLQTEDATNVISEKIGIYNTTYFYTLFKKKYGISPAQYRSEKLKNQMTSG